MILENYFKRCLQEFMPESETQWNYTAGCVLLGAQYMRKVSGDKAFDSILNRFSRDYVDDQGIIKG